MDSERAVCQELCQNTGELQVVRVEWHRVCVLPVLGETECLNSTLLWQSWCHGAS